MFLLTSCGLIEPNPFPSKDGIPPPPVSIVGYKDGQHVGGTITFSIATGSPSSRIQKVSLQIDSAQAGFPSVNTDSYSQGPHVLRFDVWVTDSTSGLLNAAGGYEYILTLGLVFDQTPPVAVSGLRISTRGGYARLSWLNPTLSNLSGYIVRRNGQPIDTIKVAGDTTYTDSSYALSDYEKVSYDIGTVNGLGAAYSQSVSLSFGTEMRDPKWNTLTLAIFPWGQYAGFYVSETQKLGLSNYTFNYALFISTTDPANSTNTEVLQDVGLFAADSSGSFLWWTLGKGSSFSVTNLSFTSPFHEVVNVPWFQGTVTGFTAGTRDSVLYYADDGGGLSVFNGFSGALYTSRQVFSGPGRFLSASPDGTKLMGFDDTGARLFNVTHGSLLLISAGTIGDSVHSAIVDWSNMRFYEVHGETAVNGWDINGITRSTAFLPPGGNLAGKTATAIAISPGKLYVAWSNQQSDAHPASVVIEYDATTGMIVRSWTFYSPVISIGYSPNGRYLFPCTSSAIWLLDPEAVQ